MNHTLQLVEAVTSKSRFLWFWGQHISELLQSPPAALPVIGPDTSRYATAITIYIKGTFRLFRGLQGAMREDPGDGSWPHGKSQSHEETLTKLHWWRMEEKNKESKTNRKKEKNKWQSREPVMSEPKNANHVGGKWEPRTRGVGRGQRKIWMGESRKRIRDRKSVTDGSSATVRRSDNMCDSASSGVLTSVNRCLALCWIKGLPERDRCTQTLPVSLPAAALAALGSAKRCELRPLGCPCVTGRSRARGFHQEDMQERQNPKIVLLEGGHKDIICIYTHRHTHTFPLWRFW